MYWDDMKKDKVILDVIEKETLDDVFEYECTQNAHFYFNCRWYISGNKITLKESQITKEMKKQIRRL